MPRSKTDSSKSTKSQKAAAARSLPVRKEEAEKVGGGKRTAIRDAHDKYANQDAHY